MDNGFKSEVKVICCDIDGTLVRTDKTLSEENIKWIHKAVTEKGVHFTLVSGRPSNGIIPFYQKMDITGPMSCFNGGTLLDENGVIVDDHRMPHDLAMKLVDINDEVHADMIIFDGMTWCLETRECYAYAPKLKIYRSDCLVGNFRDLLQKFDTNKCIFISPDSTVLDKVEVLIRQRFDLATITYFRADDYLEVMVSGYDKGTAIEALSRVYNVPTSQIMALGDADNDIAMLKVAGYSVSMANASKGAKDAARYLTDTNDNDGVAKAIQKYVFGL